MVKKLTRLLMEGHRRHLYYDRIAEFLLANGVTFANENNVGSKWIPVTERLPDAGERVLCMVKSLAFPGRKYYNLLRCDMYGFHENGIYTDDVTHWMPLPEPPKEDYHGQT